MMRQQSFGSLLTSPGSPPGMTTSKSSKSSSFPSFNSDDGSVLADIGHFEDIGLDDDNSALKGPRQAQPHTHTYTHTQPQSQSQSHAPPVRPGPSPTAPGARNLAAGKRAPKPRRSFPSLQTNSHADPRSTSLTVLTDPRPVTRPSNSGKVHTTTAVPLSRRHRSSSPGLSSNPKDPNLPPKPRRGSWQANRDRKSFTDLEHECDEDDGDDIPDGLVLDNVPMSPRPANDRPPSRAPSLSPSPERGPKDRVRSVGNGTPAVAQAQGSLRSPSWKSTERPPPSPLKMRAQSWNLALADLSAETKALTEKLEEHADEMQEEFTRRPSGSARPNTWNSSQTSLDYMYDKRERVKSSTPELPPLRRTNIMVDPLPISKEKEAVLSRTRPSWLPPKDPAEERRHLKQYQKMMAASAKAEERREAARRVKTEGRDSNADDLMHTWEGDIIPRWNEAIRERRTRDLWWRGVAPRSRGAVWTRAIGNELGLSEVSFHTALDRADDLQTRVKMDRADAEDVRRAKWFDQIRKDVSEKTWKDLRIFEVAGPLHQGLIDVLSAYAMYRNDIGYVSGCNTIAALLLLNLPDPETAFIALANVLNRPLPLSFYTSDPGAQSSAFNLVLQTLSHKSTALHEHLTKTVPDLDPELYLGDLFTAIFTSHLSIDEAARLWDVYVFEGDALLVRAAVAVLLSREMTLLGSKTADEIIAVMARANASSSTPQAVGEPGAEDRFMRIVRGAGKA